MRVCIMRSLLGSIIVILSTTLSFSSWADASGFAAYEAKWKPITCSLFYELKVGMPDTEALDRINEIFPKNQFNYHFHRQQDKLNLNVVSKKMHNLTMFSAGFSVKEKKMSFKNIGYYCLDIED